MKYIIIITLFSMEKSKQSVNKLKSKLSVITDEINKEIKKFVNKKNEELKKLEQFFAEYSSKNDKNFFNFAKKIIDNMNGQESFIKNIYLNQLYFFYIFFIPNKFILDIEKIKNSIVNCEKKFLFDVIQNDNFDEIDKDIKSKNIKNKIIVKIIISNNEDEANYLKLKHENVYYLENDKLDLPIDELIKQNFARAKKLYINEFYQKNKFIFPKAKRGEMLSQKNIIKKIKYDLEFSSITNVNENLNNIFDDFSFIFNQKNEEDNLLLKIGNDYYESLIDMIKKLLTISKIKKDNNVLDFFVKTKFEKEFINLTENIKCKCFYSFFWLTYIEKLIRIGNDINLPKIVKFEGIIKEKSE